MLNSSLKNSEKAKNNPFEEGRRNIFGKIYLANVHNRLRELENPNDVDCKRWVWELVQNAKDSISGSSDRTSVDIEIIVVGNTYTFRHNGSPLVETNDNHTIYVEVISTSNKFNNNVPLFFNEKKIQEMKEIHSHDQYVLAIVFGVKSNPIHFFMTLRDNLSYKVIQ